MAGYTPGFQPKEAGFIKLNTNENPFPPSPRAIERLAAVSGDQLRKYPDPLGDEFRQAAAEVLNTRPERILCGCGSDDVLTIAVRSFCGEGDTFAFPYPTYSLCEVLAQIQGARWETVEFPADFSLPEELARTGAKLVLVANPNAPSGTVVEPDRLRWLAGAIGGVLLIDEAYVDFAEQDCLKLTEEFDNVMVTRSLSKSYSLAGLRFGFAVANEVLIEGMMKVKDSYNVSGPSIATAAEAMRDQEWLRKNVSAIKANRGRLTGGLAALGFYCWPSQSNFVLTRVPEGRCAEEIYEKLYERKILVRYFKMRRLDDCLRITVGTESETDAALSALRDILAT